MKESLLKPRDPPTVRVDNPFGRSAFLLLGDHAGNAVPLALGNLGLGEADLTRHIAWDIGVAALGRALSERLDAVFVSQTWSRLVVDCNRDPDAPDAIPEVSDGTTIPGNLGLTDEQKRRRIETIHQPYQQAIADEIARRGQAGLATVLVSLHSFTPVWRGLARVWDAGVLHNGANDVFALRLMEGLRDLPGLTVGDNEPYRMDTIDHTVPRHAFEAGLAYAELEIRQDQLVEDADVALWADRLARCLTGALAG